MTQQSVMSDMEWQSVIGAAVQRVAAMTSMEHDVGYASPEDGPVHAHIATAADALECAIRCRDWNTATDALVTLRQALARVQPIIVSAKRK